MLHWIAWAGVYIIDPQSTDLCCGYLPLRMVAQYKYAVMICDVQIGHGLSRDQQGLHSHPSTTLRQLREFLNERVSCYLLCAMQLHVSSAEGVSLPFFPHSGQNEPIITIAVLGTQALWRQSG